MADSKQRLYLVTVLALFSQVSGFLLNQNSGNGSHLCTLESDSCNYTIQSSTTSHLHWTRQALTFASVPSIDHSLNSRGHGHVFSVRMMSTTRANDSTTLHSPIMSDLAGSTDISFWYSMSGSSTSSMNFTLYSRAYKTARKIPLFTRLIHGALGWTHVCVTLPVYLSLELIFEVVAVRNYVIGELAIDDITVHRGNNCSSVIFPTVLPHIISTPASSGESVTCNFENSSICGYKNIASSASRDDFQWSRHKGSTVSTNTGPSSDHTTQSGYYMYIETSSPRKPGQKALLESPTFRTDDSQYLEFWYHGYGASLGSLKVYIERYGTYLGRPLFTASNVSSNIWHRGCINIPITHTTSHVVFEGVVGKSYTGDYAIDDVKLGKGSCSHPLRPVDGHWGSWSAYSACSVTCGTGHVTSTRSCDKPAPSNGGLQCAGSRTRTSTCHGPSCPIDGGWSSWGAYTSCSTTCGLGSRRSTRTCTNPAPRYGGHTCSGGSSRTLTCRQVECPIDGGWGTWSPWSSCPVTCGVGNMTSTRTCNNPTPNHNGKDCTGDSIKVATCKNTPCTVDGGWSEWTLWSQCSTSCALGTMTRDRSCSNPVPAGGGKLCTGDHIESHECSLGPCPSWSHWYQGDCSSTCGNGTAERMRSCSTGNNADCAGISYEHVPCIGTECIRK